MFFLLYLECLFTFLNNNINNIYYCFSERVRQHYQALVRRLDEIGSGQLGRMSNGFKSDVNIGTVYANDVDEKTNIRLEKAFEVFVCLFFKI